MTFYSWSDWADSASNALPIKTKQTEIYIHYPGQPRPIGRASFASTRSRLRAYRRMHRFSNGWREIAYNWAVDQNGNIYELRGKNQCGGNGGTVTNRRGQAILVLVGNTEKPTDDCIRGVKECVAMIREWQPSALKIKAHRESFEANTDCPGDVVYALVKAGAFEPLSLGGGGTSVSPSTPAAKPEAGAPGKLKVDGRLGEATAKALQRFLNSRVKTRVLKVDGRLGPDTYRSLQEYLGTKVDGEISNQSHKPDELGNGIGPHGWDYDGPGASGSTAIRALQKWVGVKEDGVLGEKTIAALQRKLNVHAVGMQ